MSQDGEYIDWDQTGRGSLSEFIDEHHSKCDDCSIGCTGGCDACDVMAICDRCGQVGSWMCGNCEVKDDCDGCRCFDCDGCPYT